MPRNTANQIAAHAAKIGSGRVGRSRSVTNPEYPAVVAWVRHKRTRYDSLMQKAKASGYCNREEIREQIRPEIDAVLAQWE